MNSTDIAARLTGALALDIAPVALTFLDVPPAGVASIQVAKPSACSFWREAEKGVFFASAESHFHCPVGAMVMGFDLPAEVSAELMGLVGTMTKCGYIDADEPGRIPTRAKKGAKGVLYGPLAEFQVPADAVLLWLTPAQAMVVSEALGGAVWGGSTAANVFGRPACGAIPQAINDARVALSLGCMGMRTFTGIGAERMLVVVPGSKVDEFATEVARLSAVNGVMADFYRSRAAAVTG